LVNSKTLLYIQAPIKDNDNKTNPNAQKAGSGLFKIGDYDEPKTNNNPNLVE
jgi:hypothetical protein